MTEPFNPFPEEVRDDLAKFFDRRPDERPLFPASNADRLARIMELHPDFIGPRPRPYDAEEAVEEGLDLRRVSGGHALGDIRPGPLDLVLADFTADDDELFLAVRLLRDGLPVEPEVLGLVRAAEARVAAILTRVRWKINPSDFVLYPRDRVVAMLKLVLSRA